MYDNEKFSYGCFSAASKPSMSYRSCNFDSDKMVFAQAFRNQFILCIKIYLNENAISQLGAVCTNNNSTILRVQMSIPGVNKSRLPCIFFTYQNRKIKLDKLNISLHLTRHYLMQFTTFYRFLCQILNLVWDTLQIFAYLGSGGRARISSRK